MEKNHEWIWKEFSETVLRFIRARVNSSETAEDLRQGVFLKVFRTLPSLQSSEKLNAWIFRIARNTVIDYYRAVKPADQLPTAIPAETEYFTDEISRRLFRSCRKMADQLPEKYRRVFIEYYYKHKPLNEIAIRQELPLSTAKTRLQRARQQLQKMLNECCHFETDQRGNLLDYHEIRCCCCQKF
ncbi:MAG: sigma-70 family RNA polymerase sigma factor [Calditrichia bacterium]